MKKIVGFCPTCKYRLTAIALEEQSQEQVFEQNIAHSMFAHLSPAQTEFLSALVRCKGDHSLMAQHLALTAQEIESCFDRLLFDLKMEAVIPSSDEQVEPQPEPIKFEESAELNQPDQPEMIESLPALEEESEPQPEQPFLLPLDAPISEELVEKIMNLTGMRPVEQESEEALEQPAPQPPQPQPIEQEPTPENLSEQESPMAQPESVTSHRILPFCPPVVKREEVAFSPNPKEEELLFEPQAVESEPSLPISPVVQESEPAPHQTVTAFEEFVLHQSTPPASVQPSEVTPSPSAVSASVSSATLDPNLKPSERVREKLLACGGSAQVYSISKKTYEIVANEDGKSFSCDKLPFECDYEVFDIICALLDRQGGRAEKGTGKGTRFGDAKCNENTVVGILAKEYFGAKEGDSVYDPVFVLASVLEWAELAKNGRGYLERIK